MPLRRWLRCALVFLIVGSSAGLTFSPGLDASVDSSPALASAVQAVNSGVALERSHKWIDAILHYEKAVKAYPANKNLEYGLRRAKSHFEVERRYSDNSFRKSMLPMSKHEAMGLFDEVLSNAQRRFVENVDTTSFVAHGTEEFFLALGDDRFLDANVAPRYRGNVTAVRETLYKNFWNKPIEDRDEAHVLIARVCELGQQQLGMKPTPIVLEYVFGGCNALDDYSAVLTPGRLNDLNASIDGQFVGLGVEVRAEEAKGLLLVRVLPESPASEVGLATGEHIVRIDGIDVRQMSTDEAAEMLQGTAGSRVVLEVQPANGAASRRVSASRRAVIVKSIPVAKIIDRDRGIAYIQMNSFQKSTVQELDTALISLRQQGMRSLIWDLRDNGGGLLQTAWEVADRFINEGVLVSIRGRNHQDNETFPAHRQGTWNMPLVLLIDGRSASASEIVAGAIKDHKRGTIVGRKSFGKWSVQSFFPVHGDCGLRLTTARFYSPHGHTLGKIGVQPDIEVPEPEKHRAHSRGPGDLDSDADVQKGLEVLQGQMARR
jgi:carboxyl-terminal processing protease